MAEAAQGAGTTGADTSTTDTTATPAPDAGAPGSGTTATPGDTTTTDGGKPPATQTEKTFTQKELDRIVAKERREYQRLHQQAEERAYERIRREQAERQPSTTQPSGSQPQGMPRLEDFKDKDPGEYVLAMARWDRQQAALEDQRKHRTTEDERSIKAVNEYQEERFADADDEYPGLRERLAGKGVALTHPMLDYVLETEPGFAVGDYLAANAAESRKIAQLSPAKQVLALHEIASKLKTAPRTNTPPPIVPNDATGASHQALSTVKDDEEWARRRDKEEREKRNR